MSTWWDRLIEIPDPSPNPEEAAIERERLRQFGRRAAASLTPRQCQVLRQLLTSSTQQQIAAALGITPGRVSQIVGDVQDTMRAPVWKIALALALHEADRSRVYRVCATAPRSPLTPSPPARRAAVVCS